MKGHGPTPNEHTPPSMAMLTPGHVFNPRSLAANERAYRRGIHQALQLAADLAGASGSIEEARSRLRKAEAVAGECRTTRDLGGLAVIDYIARESIAQTSGERNA